MKISIDFEIWNRKKEKLFFRIDKNIPYNIFFIYILHSE